MSIIILLTGVFLVMFIINGGIHSSLTSSNYNSNEQMQEEIQRQQNQQFMDWSMEESEKLVAPFEQGGYDMTQGNSFNDHHTGGF